MTNIIIPTHYSLTTPNNTPFTILRDAAQHVDDDGLYHKPGTFTASVWYDDDSSQTKNTTESPVRGTQVMVYDTNNTLVGTYTTNSDGAINGSLIPGAYTFRLNDIINYINTTQQSVQFTILSETDHHVYDFGIVQNLAP